MSAELDKLDAAIAEVAAQVRSARNGSGRPARTTVASSNHRFDLDDAVDLGASPAVRDLINSSKAPSTAKAYAFDWATFTGWCTGTGCVRCRRRPAPWPRSSPSSWPTRW